MKSENSILLVVNPIAGGTDKQTIIDAVQAEVKTGGGPLEIFSTTGKNDKDALEETIKKKSPARILVVGGDGTLSLVAECIHQKEICMGIIPAGSANGMAVNLGIPSDLSDQIAIALSDNIMKVDLVFINGSPCLHIADMGINAELVKNYENAGIRGKLGYFLQSIPTIFNSESPYEFTIETEEGLHREEGVLLVIANANKFGTGANVNPTGKINDGKFEILLFKNLDFIEILKTAREEPQMSEDFVRVISVDRARISTTVKVHFQIDGEYMDEVDALKVTIEKRSLRLLVPVDFRNSY